MDIALLKFITEEDFESKDVEKLRGYIGNLFKNYLIVHHHISRYEFYYRMPKIQYKLIDKKLAIYGIEEGASFIRDKLLNLKQLDIDGKFIREFKGEFTFTNEEFEVKEELFSYRFVSPWLALNEQNYRRFKTGELNLDKQLQNNLLSNFKDCNMTINKRIMVKGTFFPIKLYMKDIELVGFRGEFICNVKIPKYMGVGKRKSIGYGCVIPK